METGKGRRWGATIFGREEGRRRGGSIVLEVDNTAKSGAAVGEAECGDWHLQVEDDQRKLGRWAECGWAELLTGPVKKMSESMRWTIKIGKGILTGQNGKEKRK
jgi:hypothetical protein